ncbi:MAG: general secretion pathway protein, partial [Sandaracinaceae bacterium]|nr:general secretion pathway protein [Sandaracinaceae bacterium]
ALFEAAAGVPRRINRIASSAMIVAAARKRNLVGAQDVHDARVDRGRA